MKWSNRLGLGGENKRERAVNLMLSGPYPKMRFSAGVTSATFEFSGEKWMSVTLSFLFYVNVMLFGGPVGRYV
jgi:hypothetical protein